MSTVTCMHGSSTAAENALQHQHPTVPGAPACLVPLRVTAFLFARPCHKLALASACDQSGAADLARLPLQKQLPSWVNFPDFEKVSWVNSVIGAALRPNLRCRYMLQSTLGGRTCLRHVRSRRPPAVVMSPDALLTWSDMSWVDRVTQLTLCVAFPSAAAQLTVPRVLLVPTDEHPVVGTNILLSRLTPIAAACADGTDTLRACVFPTAAQLWPRVQAAAEEITKRELQPLLDASKPLWVNEIRITQCAPIESLSRFMIRLLTYVRVGIYHYFVSICKKESYCQKAISSMFELSTNQQNTNFLNQP